MNNDNLIDLTGDDDDEDPPSPQPLSASTAKGLSGKQKKKNGKQQQQQQQHKKQQAKKPPPKQKPQQQNKHTQSSTKRQKSKQRKQQQQQHQKKNHQQQKQPKHQQHHKQQRDVVKNGGESKSAPTPVIASIFNMTKAKPAPPPPPPPPFPSLKPNGVDRVDLVDDSYSDHEDHVKGHNTTSISRGYDRANDSVNNRTSNDNRKTNNIPFPNRKPPPAAAATARSGTGEKRIHQRNRAEKRKREEQQQKGRLDANQNDPSHIDQRKRPAISRQPQQQQREVIELGNRHHALPGRPVLMSSHDTAVAPAPSAAGVCASPNALHHGQGGNIEQKQPPRRQQHEQQQQQQRQQIQHRLSFHSVYGSDQGAGDAGGEGGVTKSTGGSGSTKKRNERRKRRRQKEREQKQLLQQQQSVFQSGNYIARGDWHLENANHVRNNELDRPPMPVNREVLCGANRTRECNSMSGWNSNHQWQQYHSDREQPRIPYMNNTLDRAPSDKRNHVGSTGSVTDDANMNFAKLRDHFFRDQHPNPAEESDSRARMGDDHQSTPRQHNSEDDSSPRKVQTEERVALDPQSQDSQGALGSEHAPNTIKVKEENPANRPASSSSPLFAFDQKYYRRTTPWELIRVAALHLSTKQRKRARYKERRRARLALDCHQKSESPTESRGARVCEQPPKLLEVNQSSMFSEPERASSLAGPREGKQSESLVVEQLDCSSVEAKQTMMTDNNKHHHAGQQCATNDPGDQQVSTAKNCLSDVQASNEGDDVKSMSSESSDLFGESSPGRRIDDTDHSVANGKGDVRSATKNEKSTLSEALASIDDEDAISKSSEGSDLFGASSAGSKEGLNDKGVIDGADSGENATEVNKVDLSNVLASDAEADADNKNMERDCLFGESSSGATADPMEWRSAVITHCVENAGDTDKFRPANLLALGAVQNVSCSKGPESDHARSMHKDNGDYSSDDEMTLSQLAAKMRRRRTTSSSSASSTRVKTNKAQKAPHLLIKASVKKKSAAALQKSVTSTTVEGTLAASVPDVDDSSDDDLTLAQLASKMKKKKRATSSSSSTRTKTKISKKAARPSNTKAPDESEVGMADVFKETEEENADTEVGLDDFFEDNREEHTDEDHDGFFVSGAGSKPSCDFVFDEESQPERSYDVDRSEVVASKPAAGAIEEDVESHIVTKNGYQQAETQVDDQATEMGRAASTTKTPPQLPDRKVEKIEDAVQVFEIGQPQVSSSGSGAGIPHEKGTEQLKDKDNRTLDVPSCVRRENQAVNMEHENVEKDDLAVNSASGDSLEPRDSVELTAASETIAGNGRHETLLDEEQAESKATEKKLFLPLKPGSKHKECLSENSTIVTSENELESTELLPDRNAKGDEESNKDSGLVVDERVEHAKDDGGTDKRAISVDNVAISIAYGTTGSKHTVDEQATGEPRKTTSKNESDTTGTQVPIGGEDPHNDGTDKATAKDADTTQDPIECKDPHNDGTDKTTAKDGDTKVQDQSGSATAPSRKRFLPRKIKRSIPDEKTKTNDVEVETKERPRSQSIASDTSVKVKIEDNVEEKAESTTRATAVSSNEEAGGCNFVMIDSDDSDDDNGDSGEQKRRYARRPDGKGGATGGGHSRSFQRAPREPLSASKPAGKSSYVYKPKHSPSEGYFYQGKSYYNYKYSQEDAQQMQDRLFKEAAERVRLQNLAKRSTPHTPGIPVIETPIFNIQERYPEHWRWRDPHARLGLPSNASIKHVKSQWRRLARIYHPDKSNRAETSDKFNAIAAAYKRIVDHE